MSEREVWEYHFGMPDRDGLGRYTHLIMSKLDPEETMLRGSKVRDPNHWRKTYSVEEWQERILHHLRDGEPRTFNAICVELTGTTANIWMDEPPDQALWSLCEENLIAWSCNLGAVFWLRSDFVTRGAPPRS